MASIHYIRDSLNGLMQKKKKTSWDYSRIHELSVQADRMGYKQIIDKSSGRVYFELKDDSAKSFEQI